MVAAAQLVLRRNVPLACGRLVCVVVAPTRLHVYHAQTRSFEAPLVQSVLLARTALSQVMTTPSATTAQPTLPELVANVFPAGLVSSQHLIESHAMNASSTQSSPPTTLALALFAEMAQQPTKPGQVVSHASQSLSALKVSATPSVEMESSLTKLKPHVSHARLERPVLASVSNAQAWNLQAPAPLLA